MAKEYKPNDMVNVKDHAPRMNGKITPMKYIAFQGLQDETVDLSGGKTVKRYTIVAKGKGE